MNHVLIVAGKQNVLIVAGKQKGHGKMRKNIPEYITDAAPRNINKWFVELYLGHGPFPEELK